MIHRKGRIFVGPFYAHPFVGPLNVFYLLIFLAAMAVIECLIGGTRLLYSLPAYAILGVGALASLRDFRRLKVQPGALCLAASGVFFGYLIVRGLTSPVPYLAARDVFSILGSLAVYLLIACHVTDPRRRMWLLGGLLVLAGLNLGVGARQFATGTGYMLFGFPRSDAYLGRASGLYICPNHMAGYLEVVGSLALAAALWSRLKGWVKLLLGYGALCCFGGLLMTGSRGGFLSSVAALGVLGFLGLWRSRETSPETFKRVLLFAVILVGLAAVGVTMVARNSHLLKERGQQMVNTEDIRTRLWPAAIKQFEGSPWIGAGAGTYLYYGRLFRDPVVQTDPIHTHNDYLQLLGEYGAAGALGLLIFLGAHLRWGWRAFQRLSLRSGSAAGLGGSNAAALNIGALAALAAMTVHSALDFNLHIPANALLMAFVFALLANPGRELSETGRNVARFSPADWLPRLALPAVGVVLLAGAATRLPGEYHCEQARVALLEEKPMVALHEAKLGLARERSNPYLYFYLGEARRLLAERVPNPALARSFWESAVEPYREGVRLFPSDIRQLLRLGQALTASGQFDEAGKTLEQALKWDPLSGRVQTYHGFYLQRAGKFAEARAAYRRAQELMPNSTADEGFKQVQSALEADPVEP